MMTTAKALKIMQTDLGRPIKHIKSTHFPHDVLVVMAEGKIPVPEEDSYIREVRLSTFVGEQRNSSTIVHSEFIKVDKETT